MNNENIKCIKFHCSLIVRSSFKFGLSISGVRSIWGGEFFAFLENFHKSVMGKNKKKTHSKFHRDQTNVGWFKMRELILEDWSTGGRG